MQNLNNDCDKKVQEQEEALKNLMSKHKGEIQTLEGEKKRVQDDVQQKEGTLTELNKTLEQLINNQKDL